MEYLPNFSDAELELKETDERNKLPSAHEIRLNRFRDGVVPANEIDVLLGELKGKIK